MGRRVGGDSGEALCSGSRFTRVLDNSIVFDRLLDWAAAEDGVIRLHPNIAFYVQSAQLLPLAFLGAWQGEFRAHAMTELGWSISLLDAALGVLAQQHSRSPIYFSGYDPGYEEVPFPGLYDPATASDVSSLLNAFETAAAVASRCPLVDSFQLTMAPEPTPPKLLTALESRCEQTRDAELVRQALDELS
jgi:hypothetical protein